MDMETAAETINSVEQDIIDGRVEMSDQEAYNVLVQLWDSALEAGVIKSSNDAILIQKAFEKVKKKVQP